ncbi:MAG TPA: hypothetical protein GXZ66_10710 [Clostridiaceae bacterium]|nr:hypothetical protein [Clostridiaceae bacterium]HOA32411.1 hypothetical protein [Clostridia bacterium]
MEKVIALCVLLVVTVGLIGYGLFQVNSQYKDISDHIGSDASALNLRVKDGSIIGKEEVQRYFDNMDKLEYEFVYESNNIKCFVVPNTDSVINNEFKQVIAKDMESLSSRAMFKLNKQTGHDGKVIRVQVTMIDQSN